MTTVKSLAIVALLVGGTSLAIAQGPPAGGYHLWPAAQGANRLRRDQTFGRLLLGLISQPDTREGQT